MKKNNTQYKYNLKFIAKVGVIALCLGGCMATKCFTDKTITTVTSKNTKEEIKVEKKTDYTKLIDIWNNKIYNIKLDNRYLNIGFDGYEIKDNNTTKNRTQIDKYLTFDKNHFTAIKTKLQNSKYSTKYIPLISWIEEKSKVNSADNKMVLKNSNDLMKYISDTINPKDGYFSNSTIDKIIQMNEFCYYFEKNKKSFYNKGYTKNIKKCQQIQKILKKDKIDLIF